MIHLLPTFTVLGFQFYTFPFVILLALISSIATFMVAHKYEKFYCVTIFKLCLPVLAFAALGSRLLSAVTLISVSNQSFGHNLLCGGAVFYGGLLGGAAGLLLMCRANHYEFLMFSDLFVTLLPVGHGIGRLGCYLNGCCYGRPFHGALAVAFVVDGVETTVFPTWFLETGFCFVLFLYFQLAHQNNAVGNRTAIYCISYSIYRFHIEWMRGDEVRGQIGFLSSSQVISLCVLLLGFFVLRASRKDHCGNCLFNNKGVRTMQMKLFPEEFNAQRRRRAEADISAERKRSSARQRAIRHETVRPPKGDWPFTTTTYTLNRTGGSGRSCVESRTTASAATWGLIGGGAGIIIGFFVCCGMINSAESVGMCLVTWIAIAVGGCMLGAVLAGLVNAEYKSSIQKADSEIAIENARCEQSVQEIYAQAASDSANYKKAFEAEAQKLSGRYAASAPVVEMIHEMAEYVVQSIERTCRSDKIEKLDFVVIFEVHEDAIRYKLPGDVYAGNFYDFRAHCYANLATPLEQVAVAMAVAPAIQLNIAQKYSKDASGTDYVLDVSAGYSNVAYIHISYTAPNGNYHAVQNSLRTWV